jgi:geranylgeranyl diphosphate synthase type I
LATYENKLEVKGEAMEFALAPYRKAVDRELRKLRETGNDLSVVAADFVETGGKRVRPIITLLTCEALKGSYDEALPIALAYELAHAASLTQDDIIDESPTRHNRQTVHTKHGVTTAILVSDMLIFKIFEQLGAYAESGLGRGDLALLTEYVARSAKQTAEGEYLEMRLTKKSEPTVDEYIKLAGLKTGALFGAAAASGAVVGGAKPRVVKDLYEFGKNLGIAFQIVDDVLDLTGTTAELGKPMMKDLQNDVMNLVMVHALSTAGAQRKNSIRAMIKRTSYGMVDVVELLGALDDLGSVEFAAGLGRKHAGLARERLKKLPEGNARHLLEDMTGWVEVRRK